MSTESLVDLASSPSPRRTRSYTTYVSYVSAATAIAIDALSACLDVFPVSVLGA